MKTQSIELAAHRAQRTTTLAWCWKATRRDGFILAVTTCSDDLLFEGVLYRSKDGFNPKAIAQEASGAVANSEVNGYLSDEVTEQDFEAGLWDGCTVELFEVNYRALSMGKMRVSVTTMGNIKVDRGAFDAEMRGLTQSLQKVVGRTVTKGCMYRLGDPDTCRKDLGPLTVTGAITSVIDRRSFSDGGRGEAPDYFGGGVISFLTGANAGVSMEIYSFASGQFVLHLPLWQNVAVGDTYSLTPGCRKNFEADCVAKFGNGNNFGGFPHLPGNDKVLGLGGTEGTNL